MSIFTIIFSFISIINSLKIEDTFSFVQNKKPNEELIDISQYERINPDDPNYLYIPIFGTSDIHGHFYPELYDVGNISYSKGGLDYLAKYINIIRDEFYNNILYLDAGDLFQGGTESSITNGEIIMDYFNIMKTNGTTFGNHEFHKNRTFLENKISEAKFPFLATNIYDTIKKTKKAFGNNHFTSKIFTFNVKNLKKYENEENEIKIGVIGLSIKMQESQISGAGFDGIKFLDYKEELVQEANQLRKENKVNAIVLLSHLATVCGNDNMTLNMYKPTDIQEECDNTTDIYQLVNSLDEGIIDAVVTGHSHREVHHWINKIPVISPINFLFATSKLLIR